MIDPNTTFGRVMVVFFWGGLAASFTLMLWSFWHFDPIVLPWLTVIFNIVFVWIKNIVIPPRPRS